ncbi:MAG: AAA family ATPase [Polaribacter sp.]
MKEKLIIKNFGPIKSVDLDLGKITVLIGEQATGKSTVAKVLSMCRYFSYIVNYAADREKQSEYQYNPYFSKGLEYWGLNRYIKTGSYIFYENEDYIFEYKLINDDTHKTKIESKSTKFKELLNEVQELRDYEKNNAETSNIEIFYAEGWYPNELFFRLNVKKVMDNPLFIPTERGLQSISFGKGLLISDAELDALGKLGRIATKFKETSIKPLSLIYKNENNIGYIKKEDEESYYELHNAASGYKATIPIVLAVKYYNERERRGKTFIIEEPELNLFPKVQNKLMSFFVENINVNKHSFLIPTHSPYFLSAINDLLLAHKRGQINEKETSNIIGKNSWLDPKDLSVYELKEGEAFDIFNEETGLISSNIIDDVSDEMNDEFEKLLDIE